VGLEKHSEDIKARSEQEIIHLEEPVGEYVLFVASVKAALSRRQEKRSQYRAAQLDLELKQQAYNKVLGVAGKEKDAIAKQDALEKSRLMVDTVKSEFELMSDKLVSEVALFRVQKARDISAIILKYSTIQVCLSYHPYTPN
jgi:hypothetical protein